MNKTYALGLMAVVVVVMLAGCSPSTTGSGEVETEQVAWQKSGNVYSYVAEYEVPNNVVRDTFTVELDAENNVVEVAAVLPETLGKHEEGVKEFVDELRPMVVGMNISELGEFDTISGSSLTTDAFNEGLLKLQQQLRQS